MISPLRLRGFTLLEVLVVIVIISLFFSMVFGVYFFIITKSLKTMRDSKEVYNYLNTLYSIKKAIECAKTIKIDNSQDFSKIYLYTYCGMYKGFSKEVFFVKGNILYVYSYPYAYGDLLFYEPNNSVSLIPVKSFKVKFIPNNLIDLKVNGKRFIIPTLTK